MHVSDILANLGYDYDLDPCNMTLYFCHFKISKSDSRSFKTNVSTEKHLENRTRGSLDSSSSKSLLYVTFQHKRSFR